ncbi:carnosine N-methyltransferase-like isoform X1 [Olea europaea var. sylvestris]|uniref:carnosine N-methyltransferase-like isoform X1 n=1 Tax=Olea europaea var. sylvestris TaxID=158386 RepID=UPI000C1CD480|nr:carnosine N-methyltransferase-like isoform X1 [Olea europaea var. sylvestris]
MSRMEDEEFRRRKMEEVLEVKSLRRIISAYLNYPEAAEEDIRRYESYFRRLPPSHKALLSHLPLKFKKLRWCISQNSYFIFEMLKAFDPPLDMSQDIDISSEQFVDDVSDNNPFSGERNPCQCESSSGQISSLKADELRFGGSANAVHGSPKAEPVCEEKKTNPSVESNPENCSIGSAFDKKVCVSSPDWLDPALQLHVPLVDVDKVRCIIRNVVRDWASEGQSERDQCYKPILEELGRLFPDRTKGSPHSCLVPGAGLGRLALEISCLGFISQGNEFSYYMMICSSFILNHTQTAEEWTIYPWVHSNCNSLSDSDQLRPVSFPDIHPASAGITEGFSMCGGDFVEVYNDPSQVGVWDAVVTCFFIDTAHNVVEYIEIISRILKDGGVWINLGPLLYHFADMYNQEDDMSIELSLEDVKRVASHYGFQIEKESTIETTYTTNPRSMMQNRYFASFWTMRKKPFATTEQGA